MRIKFCYFELNLNPEEIGYQRKSADIQVSHMCGIVIINLGIKPVNPWI